MTTMPAIEMKSGSFRAEAPQSWETCDDCVDENVVPPHIAIYAEDGKLLAGPECGQWRLQYAVAGHLALLASVSERPVGTPASFWTAHRSRRRSPH